MSLSLADALRNYAIESGEIDPDGLTTDVGFVDPVDELQQAQESFEAVQSSMERALGVMIAMEALSDHHCREISRPSMESYQLAVSSVLMAAGIDLPTGVIVPSFESAEGDPGSVKDKIKKIGSKIIEWLREQFKKLKELGVKLLQKIGLLKKKVDDTVKKAKDDVKEAKETVKERDAQPAKQPEKKDESGAEPAPRGLVKGSLPRWMFHEKALSQQSIAGYAHYLKEGKDFKDMLDWALNDKVHGAVIIQKAQTVAQAIDRDMSHNNAKFEGNVDLNVLDHCISDLNNLFSYLNGLNFISKINQKVSKMEGELSSLQSKGGSEDRLRVLKDMVAGSKHSSSVFTKVLENTAKLIDQLGAVATSAKK